MGRIRTILAATSFLGIILAGILICSIRNTVFYLNEIGSILENQMGFEHGSPYVNGEEVLIISKIMPGGIMDQAGLRVGDMPSHGDMVRFYKDLWNNRGSELPVTVVNMYDDPHFSKNREVVIPVPSS